MAPRAWKAWVLSLAAAFLAPAGSPRAAEPALDAAALGRAIGERRARVIEFAAIKEAAEELGVRVWLFGGTAAGFAHYVRWDLLREAGDPRYRGSFFDYDFTNVYRSTQDADLVVDGSPEQAAALESLIRQKMSFLQGSKDHWEVRLLRQDRVVGRRVKQALLANPDFMEQHTDSNSTGMVELTDPPRGEGMVRDLRDWQEQIAPVFLQDVTEGRLHYYWSPTHEKTTLFREGNNPPLFSVIRYLVKAFQYDLTIDGQDLLRIQSIIEAFDPARDYPLLSDWAKGWLERYGPNLIRHSVNIEYAWNTLEALGLRAKLVGLSDRDTAGTLGWWLSREPLRTQAVGQGQGRTAAQLGIEVVAHGTEDFLAYESITRDVTLRPNVLVSRENATGEGALLGEGFYTVRGRKGRGKTGLTIRFAVDPGAREGTDFTVHDDVVLFTNRAALKVIPESLSISWLGFFEMLKEGLQVDPSDLGVWTKLRRRLAIKALGPEEEGEILRLVQEAAEQIGDETRGRLPWMLWEWFDQPFSARHPEVVAGLIRKAKDTQLRQEACLESGGGRECRDEYGRDLMASIAAVLRRPHWANPELFGALIEAFPETWLGWTATVDSPFGSEAGCPGALLGAVFNEPHWQRHPELVQRLIDHGGGCLVAGREIFKQPGWEGHPELMLSLVGRMRGTGLGKDLRYVIGLPQWRDQPALRSLCGGAAPTLECLQEAPFSGLGAESIARELAVLSSAQYPGECR